MHFKVYHGNLSGQNVGKLLRVSCTSWRMEDVMSLLSVLLVMLQPALVSMYCFLWVVCISVLFVDTESVLPQTFLRKTRNIFYDVNYGKKLKTNCWKFKFTNYSSSFFTFVVVRACASLLLFSQWNQLNSVEFQNLFSKNFISKVDSTSRLTVFFSLDKSFTNI